MASEIEKIFHQETREKKRIGANIHKKTGVRGYVGKMLFPTDVMSRKEKYNYRKAGKVRTYKMNEVILSKEQFDKKDEETQRVLLTKWRELYSNKEIMKSMGIKGNAAFHNLIVALKVPKKTTRFNAGRPKKSAPNKKIKGVSMTYKEERPQEALPAPQQQVMVKEEPQVELVKTGLQLEYIGEYSADQLAKIFTKLQLIIDGEDNKFTIKISLRENENN